MKQKMQEHTSNEALLSLIRQVQADNASAIGHNDQAFLQRIYDEGLQKYIDRLKAIGFSGKERVLDAGCGYGQWSLALAGLNDNIESCDISPLRIDFLRSLACNIGISSLTAQISGIDRMPYPNNYFDAVFCYGVIFLTPWRDSLSELARVLKPGGRMYVNANGLGWYIFLWQEEHNKATGYDPKAIAPKCLADTLTYEREGIYKPGMILLIEPELIKKKLEDLGFTQVIIAQEGCLHLDQTVPAPKPFFNGEYKGLTGVYEVVATKL